MKEERFTHLLRVLWLTESVGVIAGSEEGGCTVFTPRVPGHQVELQDEFLERKGWPRQVARGGGEPWQRATRLRSRAAGGFVEACAQTEQIYRLLSRDTWQYHTRRTCIILDALSLSSTSLTCYGLHLAVCV